MDHRKCRFGEWLTRERDAERGRQPNFHEVEAVHREVHALSGTLIALHAEGQVQAALARLPELIALRERLLHRLDRLIGSLDAAVHANVMGPRHAHAH